MYKKLIPKIIAIFPMFVIMSFFYKLYFIEIFIGKLTGCNGCFILPAFKHDAIIFSGLIFLFYLSIKVNRIIGIILRFSIVLLFFFYVFDIVILSSFTTHLTTGDIVKYIDSTPEFFRNIFANVLPFKVILLTAIFGMFYIIVVTIFVLHSVKESRLLNRILMTMAPLLLLSYFVVPEKQYVHSWVCKNVFEYNYSRGYNVEYSDKVKKRINAHNEDKNCTKKESHSENIIIVIFESLSMYHSNYFSGILDNVPNIDRIAKENIAFENFFANGFTTEDGLISILTGLLPISAPQQYTDGGGFAFEGFYHINSSLPAQLKKADYTSLFLTTGDLKFSNKRKWLKSIGFDYIEGHEHPYYESWKRYVFSAAPDEALYSRAIDRINNSKQDNPYFLVIETVSTHHPYINPENDEYSETGAFFYADKALGEFYDYLMGTNYFESGMLIIVSDHRSMTPLRREEFLKYNAERAPARIPLIISFGGRIHAVEDGMFQQTDLYSSIISYVSKRSCVSRWYGDLFRKPRTPADFVFYKRGDNRDLISVFWGSQDATVQLNGDKTAVASGDRIHERVLVDKINYERIQREIDSSYRRNGLIETSPDS